VPARDLAGQRLALDVGHDDEEFAVDFLDVMDGADVRVMRLRGGSRFIQEAALSGFGESLLRQEFQRHQAFQARVLGLIHLAHASLADAAEDAIARDLVARFH